MPAGIPNLIVNGSSGIAVGMATNIPPHNLNEVVAALTALIDNPETTPTEIRKLVKGPDFPTGGYIYGRAGIKDYQETGRGRIVMRARAVIEEKESSNKSQIVVTEIPYQVNSAKLIEDIAALVRDKKLDGISDLRNESDREGLRIVIELKRDAIPRVVLNQLYKHTQMQTTFGVIMLALVPDPTTRRLVPKVMALKEALEHYVAHRHEVIVRRAQYELDKALEREHILEGLKIAVDNIDAVIKVIRAADDPSVAGTQLQARFKLSEHQADAILNMRLAKLTGLEIEKLEAELREVRAFISEMRALLDSREKRMALLKTELQAINAKYGDERRSEITSDEGEFTIEDLIADEEMVVTISHSGYIKRTAASTYRKQRRGGRGLNGQQLRDEDFIEHLFIASTHEYLLVFTGDGRCFWLRVHEIPQAGRAAKGKPVVNLINVSPDTAVQAILPVREFRDDQFLLFSTTHGTVKKTALSAYANPRANGIKAIKIEEGDELMDVQITSGTNDIVLATRHGLSIRFHEQDVREMGRDTTGVKGIELGARDEVIGMVVIKRDATLLVVAEKGIGKCSPIEEYRVQKRGGKGIITMHRTEKTGDAVSIMEVLPEDELMLMTKQGILIRMPVKGIRVAAVGAVSRLAGNDGAGARLRLRRPSATAPTHRRHRAGLRAVRCNHGRDGVAVRCGPRVSVAGAARHRRHRDARHADLHQWPPVGDGTHSGRRAARRPTLGVLLWPWTRHLRRDAGGVCIHRQHARGAVIRRPRLAASPARALHARCLRARERGAGDRVWKFPRTDESPASLLQARGGR